MRILDRIEVKQNLKLVMRERGKIIARREGHNIWTDLGAEYLAELIALTSYDPDVPIRNDRIKYMGVGIGGISQKALDTANAYPIGGTDPNPPHLPGPYTGTNEQTDTDPEITTLERPVRLAGTFGDPVAEDTWIGLIGIADRSEQKQTTFSRVFSQLEINYGPFVTMPLSEIGLYTSAADPSNYHNSLVAYDTFDTLSKISAFDLEVLWTIRF